MISLQCKSPKSFLAQSTGECKPSELCWAVTQDCQGRTDSSVFKCMGGERGSLTIWKRWRAHLKDLAGSLVRGLTEVGFLLLADLVGEQPQFKPAPKHLQDKS